MALSEQEIARIKQSFDDLEPNLEPTSVHFYEELFVRAPHMRSLFREDLKGQGMRFMNTLGLILDNMVDPDTVPVNYEELGRMHRVLGIKRGDFAPMEDALIASLAFKLGDGFDGELETLWRAAYRDFSARLVAEGDIPD
ncbi:globin domain-containing protein [Tropicimonas sp.]|uniref:globin domain-containing protein n=1 Tax=Tropicimonas sp. TaxID=2067044 RepID=UPI003A8788F5